MPHGQPFTRCGICCPRFLFSWAMAHESTASASHLQLCASPCLQLPVKPAAHRCVGGVPYHREAASIELGARWVIDTLHWHKMGLWCLSPPREITGGKRLHQFCPEPSVLLHLLHTLSYQGLYSHRLVQCTPLGRKCKEDRHLKGAERGWEKHKAPWRFERPLPSAKCMSMLSSAAAAGHMWLLSTGNMGVIVWKW